VLVTDDVVGVCVVVVPGAADFDVALGISDVDASVVAGTVSSTSMTGKSLDPVVD